MDNKPQNEKGQLHEVEEGPYYKGNSPERNNIVEENTYGDKLVLEGHVLDTNGNPVSGAWVDFWHADGRGEYDNTGYNLRGHQYTDDTGYFHLKTVMPALYGIRTLHIHVKVRANSRSRVYTTQLFFVGVETNEKDPIFEPANVMEVSETPEGKRARFDMVIEVSE